MQWLQCSTRNLRGLIEFVESLAENLELYRRFLGLRADNTKILPLELLSFASASDSDNLRDTDSEEVLEELVQCVVCVAAGNMLDDLNS